jgi:hypothetical protein
VYGDGAAPGEPDAVLTLDASTVTALANSEVTWRQAVGEGRVSVVGETTVAKVLRGE